MIKLRQDETLGKSLVTPHSTVSAASQLNFKIQNAMKRSKVFKKKTPSSFISTRNIHAGLFNAVLTTASDSIENCTFHT